MRRGGFPSLRFAVDALVLLATVVVAGLWQLRGRSQPDGTWFLLAYPVLVLLLLAFRGRYLPTGHPSRLDVTAHVLGATSLAAMLVIAVVSVAWPDSRPVLLVGPVWLLSGPALLVVGTGLEWARMMAHRKGYALKPTVIIGAGAVGERLERRLVDHPELGLRPIGFLDEQDGLSNRRVLGGPADLRSVVSSTRAEHVILSFLRAPDSAVLPLIRDCEELGIGISVVPRFFETTTSRVVLEHIGGLPLFALRRVNPKGWQFTLKHVFDRAASALVIAVLSPLLVTISLAVKSSSSGPLLYRQTRIGRDGRQFEMLKFRTMSATSDETSGLVLDADTAPGGVEGVDRRSLVGKFLRRASLDELPQLFNVFHGDMSLVGPRPERPEFATTFAERIERYTDRHRVKSGITGWAQVHGLRGQTSLSDRVEWDNYYIENWSLWLDIKIVLMTVVAVFRSAE